MADESHGTPAAAEKKKSAPTEAATPPARTAAETAACPADNTCLTLSRCSVATGIIVAVVGLLAGYIISLQSTALGVNDRSRWNTVWSLLERGNYEIFTEFGDPARREAVGAAVQLKTIDRVMKDGREYSSKPPLLPTVMAGVVWLMQRAVNLPFAPEAKGDSYGFALYAKTCLFLFQLLPLVLLLKAYRCYLDRYAARGVTWFYCMLTAAFGTYVTGYQMVLNNHVVAAPFAFLTVYFLLDIVYEGKRDGWRFAAAGLCVGWTAANELPAGLLAVIALFTAIKVDWKKALVWFIPPLAVVTLAFFLTNYLAVGTVIPAYMKKEFYAYPGSAWNDPTKTKEEMIASMSGIDALNYQPESKWVYFLHMTIGHHGWFVLTPWTIFAAFGLAGLIRGQKLDPALKGEPPRALGWWILIAWAGAFTFYWLVTDQHNYGGRCHGLRWLMWTSTLWLMALPFAVDRWLAAGRSMFWPWVCLAISAMSMADALERVWTNSWWHRFLYGFQWPWPIQGPIVPYW